MNIKMKKKLLIVNQHFATGGIKKSLDNLLSILLEQYEVRVLFISGSTKQFENKYPNVLISSPFILTSVLSSLKDLKEMDWFIVRLFLKIIGLLIGKCIGMEKTINSIIKISRKLGDYDCAISYSHDNWFENGNFFGGSNEFVLKKVNAKKKIAWIHGELDTIGLNKERLFKTYKSFNEVITVSKACKNQFESLSNGIIKCQCIYNLLNIEDIKNKLQNIRYSESNSIFRIVTVARLSKIAKRVDKINEIAKLLRDKGYNFKWIVVGGGSEYESCINICKEYGLESMVYYVGNQENPYTYIKESDLFVLVSDTEAMPVVIQEALIIGTPVVTTNFSAAYESVIDGKNGFIVKKDIQSIYEKVVYCMEHKEQLKEFRKYMQKNQINNEKTIIEIKNIIG